MDADSLVFLIDGKGCFDNVVDVKFKWKGRVKHYSTVANVGRGDSGATDRQGEAVIVFGVR